MGSETHKEYLIVNGKMVPVVKDKDAESFKQAVKDVVKTVGYMKGCNHYRQPLKVGRFNFTITSYRAMQTRGKGDEVVVPDYGIYFASEWLGLMGDMWSNKLPLPTNGTIKYPCTVVNWKDFGTVKAEIVDKLIQISLTRAGLGQMVDFGCFGAHGRTGTFLACLLGRAEHMDGLTAIKELRSRYCHFAIESQEQVGFILRYLYQYEQEKEMPKVEVKETKPTTQLTLKDIL